MSKDPAFLFYDGDAAKDVSHMNRLERGGYYDIIQAQRKFGSMSIELVKKVLGNDFDTIWPAIKPVMTYVKDMFSIEWLSESIKKREKYCKSRQDNRKHGKINKIDKQHMSNICETYVEHMEDENENENKDRSADRIKIVLESFKSELNTFLEYPEYLRTAFYDYWTEPNKSKTKLRFELEKTWDTNRRLNTWASRDRTFNKPQSDRGERLN